MLVNQVITIIVHKGSYCVFPIKIKWIYHTREDKKKHNNLLECKYKANLTTLEAGSLIWYVFLAIMRIHHMNYITLKLIKGGQKNGKAESNEYLASNNWKIGILLTLGLLIAWSVIRIASPSPLLHNFYLLYFSFYVEFWYLSLLKNLQLSFLPRGYMKAFFFW